MDDTIEDYANKLHNQWKRQWYCEYHELAQINEETLRLTEEIKALGIYEKVYDLIYAERKRQYPNPL